MSMSVPKPYALDAVSADRRISTVWIVLTLAAVTILSYGNCVLNGFVWDDHDIIVNNPTNRDLSQVWSLFGSPDSTVMGNQKEYYRPLNRLSYVLDYQIFGLNPAGYHLENLLIHLMTVILLYFAARMLFSEAIPAYLAALLFAVHPVNAEAVNFLAARNTLLSAFFVLLALLAYRRAATGHAKAYYCLSGLFFLLGLFCKEPALMLPIVLFIHELADYRAFRAKFMEKALAFLSFFLATAIYLVLRAYALTSLVGAGQSMQGIVERLVQNVYIIPKYALIILFPLRLNANYSVPQNYAGEALWLLPIWVLILVLLYFLDKKRPATRFGLIWFAVNYIPISNIVPIPSAAMAERYLYLPAIGLWIVAADQAYRFYIRFPFRKTLVFSGAAVALFFAVVTVNRNFDWKDDLRFFTRMVEADPESALAHFSLGLAYRERNDILHAQQEWEKAARIDPGRFSVLGYLGESNLMLGNFERAEYYYSREMGVNPNDATSVYNLAVIKEKLGKGQESRWLYERFLSMQPDADENLRAKVAGRIALLKKSAGNK